MTDRDEPPSDPRATYDLVARRYAETYADDLAEKVLDRALLAAFAELVQRAPGGPGRVGDLGCGPGFEARHLAELGLDVLGVDLAPNMIAEAQRRHANALRLEFRVGSLLALPLPDAALAGAIAIYSIIHLEPGQRPLACRELARVVRPGGPLLLSVHVSAVDFPAGSRRRMSTWWDHTVALDGYFIDPDEVIAGLAAVGFTLAAKLVRGPSTAHEFASQRAYLLATRDV
jgi:SAM-dependent methyltransferase